MAANMAAMSALMQNVQMPDVTPTVVTLPAPPAFEAALEPNNVLENAQRVAFNNMAGPESLVLSNGYAYTGMSGGQVVVVHPNGTVALVKDMAAEICGGRRWGVQEQCARPLGVRQYKGYLIVVDSYSGIYAIHPTNRQQWHLVDTRPNPKLKFINDLALTRDGIIYFTSSSSKYNRTQFFDLLVDGEKTGMLMKFDPNKRTTTEVLAGLSFPNGVEISPDESYILVVVAGLAQIKRYWLKPPQPNWPRTEIFADNLPCFPDNIRYSKYRGTYWLACSSIRSKAKPSVLDEYGQDAQTRKIILGMPREQVLARAPKHGLVLELDVNGKILRSLHDPQGKAFSSVSEVEEDDNFLYIGSYNAPYLGKIPKSKLPPVYKPPPPTPAPVTDPLLKTVERVRESIKNLPPEKLREVILSLFKRLLEAKIEAQRAVERANRVQQQLNAATGNTSPSDASGTVANVASTVTTNAPDTTKSFFQG